MHQLKYVIYQEGQYYVAQCLNVDVSSFGNSIDEAFLNLKEATELFFSEDQISETYYHEIGNALIGEFAINA